MKRVRVLAVNGWLLCLSGVLLTAASAAPKQSTVAQQERINRALQGWLDLMNTERFYLVLDRQRQEIRLGHGNAVLRNCPFVAVALTDSMKERQTLSRHLRRYRPSDPWSQPQKGRFDWEQNLVEDAPETAALYFSDGLLLYAADVWQHPRAPALRLNSADLRALYNALEVGTPLIVLPEHWETTD